MSDGIRAFSDVHYDYYELQEDLAGIVPKGAIFVHDTDDHENGSPAHGCLKLCWTPDGNIYRGRNHIGICGGTVIFHAEFANTSMFKLVRKKYTPECYKVDTDKVVEELYNMQKRIGELIDEVKSGL